MAISAQSTKHIHHEDDRTAMSGVLKLGNVFQLVNDGLNERALAGEQLARPAHQAVLHSALRLGKELDAIVLAQLSSQGLRDITPLSKDLAKQVFEQLSGRFTNGQYWT